MIEARHRLIDDNGTVIFGEEDLFELMYEGFSDIEGVTVADGPDRDRFNENAKRFGLYEPFHEYDENPDKEYPTEWFIPAPFNAINIRDFCLSLCKSDVERERVNYEMEFYDQLDLENLLRLMLYLVDTMRQNDIVWGVGRGSSVSSYVLFLIGVHKVNSIVFNLDFHDFIKDD